MIAQNTENDPKIPKFEALCTETCKLSLEAMHSWCAIKCSTHSPKFSIHVYIEIGNDLDIAPQI